VSELLFSYGTLRQREVQVATFGREVEGYVDAIIGYDLEYVTITDPHVIATSGSDRNPILRPTDRPDAHIDGTVFTLSEAELAAADDYEVDDYRRISVPLRSGPQAWVYVFAGQRSPARSHSRGKKEAWSTRASRRPTRRRRRA
jgi:gamma-glutamylcyclotransferase (GGCT)/AIG2-like uncharacterized protein YtfP